MTVVLDWTNEQNPEWDGTGTVAESWTAEHEQYVCRIDRFTAESVREYGSTEYAYTVHWLDSGAALPHGENESAESFEAAEEACIALLTK